MAWLCKAEKDSITPHIRFAVTADEAEGFREHYEGRQCIVTITALAPIAQTAPQPEQSRLAQALRRIADSAAKHVEQGERPDLVTVAHWVGVADSALSAQGGEA